MEKCVHIEKNLIVKSLTLIVSSHFDVNSMWTMADISTPEKSSAAPSREVRIFVSYSNSYVVPGS